MRDISKRLTVINTEKKDNASDSKGQSSGVTYVGFGGGGVKNLNDYLLKSIWDRVWEIRTDSQGTEYIFGKLPVVTQYGITMYSGENMDIPAIAEGLPFDEKTIWFNPSTKQIEVIGGIGGGAITLGSLANVGSWADSVASQDRIMYQAANSSQWVAKNLSDLAVGGLTGDYLPLSGGTLTNTLTIDNSTVGLILHRSGQATPYIRFGQDTNNEWGELGVYNDGRLVFWPLVSSQGGYGQWNTIWHSGNDGSGSGLDADLLDGMDATAFFCDKGASNSFDDKIYNGAYRTSSFNPNDAYGYGLVASFRSMEACAQIYFPDWNDEPQFRMQWNSQTSITNGWTALVTSSSIGKYNAGSATRLQAYTHDSGDKVLLSGTRSDNTYERCIYDNGWGLMLKRSLTNTVGYIATIDDNVASATKLYTARTIWGQSFDGTGNVSGDFVAHFVKIYDDNVIETTSNDKKLHLNYYVTSNMSLCYGGGNVGIGTTSPGEKLQVNGNISTSQGFLQSWIDCNGSTGGYLRLAGYYTPLQEQWTAIIASDFYGQQWCTTDGFTHGMIFKSGRNGFDNFVFIDSNGNPVARLSTTSGAGHHHFVGDMLVTGGVTMYSDIRKKTKLKDVVLSLQQVANAPLIEHYYNSDENKTTHVGSIAQYWAEMNDWFCKKDSEGFYTMEIQNAALASAISVARELVKFETETDRRIKVLEEENKRLKEEVEQLKWNIA